MGAHRHKRQLRVWIVRFAVSAAMGCIALGLPGAAMASSAPTIASVSVSHVTEHDATLEAQINPNGLETTYELYLSSPACQADWPEIGPCMVIQDFSVPGGNIPAGSGDRTVSLDLNSAGVKLQAGTWYEYSVSAQNAAGRVPAGRTTKHDFKTLSASAAPSEVQTEPAEVISGGAKLKGKLNPDGLPTTYYYEYIGSNEVQCLDIEPGMERCWHETTHAGPIAGDTRQEVPPIEVTGLAAGVTYHYRLVATNADRTVFGNEASFTVGSLPVIESVSLSRLTATDATLEAQINTEGLETTYEFQMWSSPCSKHGSGCELIEDIPLPSGKLLGSFLVQDVSLDLNSAGVTLRGGDYGFSVKATNAAGSAERGHGQVFEPPEPVVQPLNTTTSPQPGVGQFPASGNGDQSAGSGDSGSGGSSSSSTPGLQSPGPGLGKTIKLKTLTRAQEFAKALKACEKRPKSQLAKCERQARKQYHTTASKARKLR
jgi:hypothetical protein